VLTILLPDSTEAPKPALSSTSTLKHAFVVLTSLVQVSIEAGSSHRDSSSHSHLSDIFGGYSWWTYRSPAKNGERLIVEPRRVRSTIQVN
jgi:hypothetical protein